LDSMTPPVSYHMKYFNLIENRIATRKSMKFAE
jgi:hypothetical protein